MASSLAADTPGALSMRRLRGRSLWPAAALAAALIALPLVGNDFLAYQVALFLIYGIATQSVALCWGRLGFLPLGHALFFGLGAYLAGGTAKAGVAQPLWWLAFPLALLLPALLAWVVARLVFARRMRSGPYFSLITLAMTMLGFLAAQQWTGLTGGFNGMGDIPEPPGLERFSTLYWLVAAAAVASTATLGVLVGRPLGVLWRAIAQNEERLLWAGRLNAPAALRDSPHAWHTPLLDEMLGCFPSSRHRSTCRPVGCRRGIVRRSSS